MDLPLSDFRKMAVQEFDTTKLLDHAAQQARDRNYSDFLIVDVDSHHYESESMGEILEYMDDPVIQQLAMMTRAGNSKGVGVLPGGVGYQDMGGRVTRYPLRAYREGRCRRQASRHRADQALDGCDRHRHRRAVPDADAATRPAPAGRGRGGAGARL